MNPVFIITVIVGAIFLWAGIAFLFPVIGNFVRDYIRAIKGVIEEEDEND